MKKTIFTFLTVVLLICFVSIGATALDLTNTIETNSAAELVSTVPDLPERFELKQKPMFLSKHHNKLFACNHRLHRHSVMITHFSPNKYNYTRQESTMLFKIANPIFKELIAKHGGHNIRVYYAYGGAAKPFSTLNTIFIRKI